MVRHVTNTSQGNIYGSIYGKVVILNGWVKVNSGKARYAVLFVDLPATKHNVTIVAYDETNKTAIILEIDTEVGREYLVLGEDIGSRAGNIISFHTTYLLNS